MKTKIALLGLALIPFFAKAQSSSFAVKCYPKIHFQGEVASVVVARGVKNVPAVLNYGNSLKSQTQNYIVEKAETANLRYSHYKGPGFLMVVDVTAGTAKLKAKLGNEIVKLSGLHCDFNEFDPHPGVTISN